MAQVSFSIANDGGKVREWERRRAPRRKASKERVELMWKSFEIQQPFWLWVESLCVLRDFLVLSSVPSHFWNVVRAWWRDAKTKESQNEKRREKNMNERKKKHYSLTRSHTHARARSSFILIYAKIHRITYTHMHTNLHTQYPHEINVKIENRMGYLFGLDWIDYI